MTPDSRAPGVRVEVLDRPPSDRDITALADLLIDAVDSGAAVSFLAPLSRDAALSWWRRTVESAPERACILVARDDQRIVGSVQLLPAWAPNQPHRAEIAKLLVRRDYRGKGFGTRLMQSAESKAIETGFELLTLDAKRGGPADRLYRSLGWVVVGVIPNFAVDPDGATPHDAVIFYKRIGERDRG